MSCAVRIWGLLEVMDLADSVEELDKNIESYHRRHGR